jgi:hypothetical protein
MGVFASRAKNVWWVFREVFWMPCFLVGGPDDRKLAGRFRQASVII